VVTVVARFSWSTTSSTPNTSSNSDWRAPIEKLANRGAWTSKPTAPKWALMRAVVSWVGPPASPSFRVTTADTTGSSVWDTPASLDAGGPVPARAGGSVGAVTTAQTVFAVALAAVALAITVFSVYVVSSTMWGDRWYGRR